MSSTPEPEALEVEEGEVKVSPTGDVVIGVPTAVAIFIPTPPEEGE